MPHSVVDNSDFFPSDLPSIPTLLKIRKLSRVFHFKQRGFWLYTLSCFWLYSFSSLDWLCFGALPGLIFSLPVPKQAADALWSTVCGIAPHPA